jgi:hypothetical protein
MSGEIGFTFEEVKRREWRTKTWIEATKHRFYGINVNTTQRWFILVRGRT